jgi:hypothetical protein
MSDSGIRRYVRPVEQQTRRERITPLTPKMAEQAIALSMLSSGSKTLLRGLLELGSVQNFPGGGIGIEYGSLLKTAVRPDIVAGHVEEAAKHLQERQVDVLLVPGMSGFPIGSIYSYVAGIPAILLRKSEIRSDRPLTYSAGAFVIPSYTGEGDVVMTADPTGVQDIVDGLLATQLAAQKEAEELHFALRCAGADDIIDKATMSHAISESASVIGEVAIETFVSEHRKRTGDQRRAHAHVEVVAWVTPLIKTYNDPQGQLRRSFGITPFSGLSITGLQTDPQAIGIEGVGMLPLHGHDR